MTYLRSTAFDPDYEDDPRIEHARKVLCGPDATLVPTQILEAYRLSIEAVLAHQTARTVDEVAAAIVKRANAFEAWAKLPAQLREWHNGN